MKLSEIKKSARLALKGNWGKAILLSIIIFLITTFIPLFFEINMSGGFSELSDQDTTPLGADLMNMFLSILFIPLTTAGYWFYLHLVRYQEPRISHVFGIYKNIGLSIKIIGTAILTGIFTFLWFLLFIIPGIIKSISYSQGLFLLRDHPEYSPLDAIRESKKRMKGFKWKYFLLNLSFIGWGILAIFTLGIGFIWLVPYIGTSQAAFYNELISVQAESDFKSVDLEEIKE